MVGSLIKISPWKQTLQTYNDGPGAEHPLVEANIPPGEFSSLTGADPMLWQSIVLCLTGIALIAVIEFSGRKIAEKKEKSK